MKRFYNEPFMEITQCEETDIVRTSPTYGTEGTDDYGFDFWDE